MKVHLLYAEYRSDFAEDEASVLVGVYSTLDKANDGAEQVLHKRGCLSGFEWSKVGDSGSVFETSLVDLPGERRVFFRAFVVEANELLWGRGF